MQYREIVNGSPEPAREDFNPELPGEEFAWDFDPAREEVRGQRDPIEVLQGSSARAILARLLAGDPLELGRRCQEQLRNGGWLLDARLLFWRSAARAAYRARSRRRDSDLDLWLEGIIEDSIEELLVEEQEKSRTEIPPAAWDDSRACALAGLLGMEPSTFRSAVTRFHALPISVRKTFFSAVIDGISIDELVLRGFGTHLDVERSLTLALEALSSNRGDLR